MTLRLGVMCCESAQQARLVREGLHALRTISQYRKKTIRANRTLTSHGGQGVKVFVMLDLLWSGRSSGEAVDGVDERLARFRCVLLSDGTPRNSSCIERMWDGGAWRMCKTLSETTFFECAECVKRPQ